MLRLLLLCALASAVGCGGSKGGGSGLTSEDLYGPAPTSTEAPRHTVLGEVVSDITGRGLAGATVQVDESVATSDAEGRFEVTVARVGLLNAVVTAEGYWEALYVLDVAEGINEVTLEINFHCEKTAHCPVGRYCDLLYCKEGSPAFLTGKVTGICSGKPLSARVTLGDRVTCSSAEDGSFRFDGLVAGDTADFRVEKAGYESIHYVEVLDPGENVTNAALLPTGETCEEPPDVPCR